MRKIPGVPLLLLLLLQMIFGCSEREQEKFSSKDLSQYPNILWLVTEDMGPYLPAFGDSTIETPNLSRLAREGVIYPRLFSPSGVCAPSRESSYCHRYVSFRNWS